METTVEKKYYRIGQYNEPKGMYGKDRKIDLEELSQKKEITEEEANQTPHWGSGTIAVNPDGSWNWVKTNHDSGD